MRGGSRGSPRPDRPGAKPLPLPEILRGLEGKWVALRADEVIEVGDSSDVLLERLRSKRIHNYAMIRVPTELEHDAELIGFG